MVTMVAYLVESSLSGLVNRRKKSRFFDMLSCYHISNFAQWMCPKKNDRSQEAAVF